MGLKKEKNPCWSPLKVQGNLFWPASPKNPFLVAAKSMPGLHKIYKIDRQISNLDQVEVPKILPMYLKLD